MVNLGLTDAQWKPLLLLRQGGCTTAVDLSRISCHDAGSITRLLDRLEAKALIQRVRSAEDRRVVNLELTEEGKKIAAQVPEIIVGLANEVLTGFFPRRIRTIHATADARTGQCALRQRRRHPMRLKSLAALVSASTLLAACASYSGIAPEFHKLELDNVQGVQAIAYADWPKDDAYRELNDPELTRLIEQVLADSPTVQAAIAKLNRAKSVSGLAESALWPQTGASISTTHERFSENGQTPPPYAGTVQDINDAQINGSWELDFFGKNRENLKASVGELRATEAETQATRVLLANNVARSYYALGRLLAQRELSEERARQRADLAQLVERRVKAGLDTRVELELAQGVLPEIARDIASLDEQIGLARHTLAALIGQGPNAVDALTPKLPTVTALPLPESVPADLLGHRADVVAARWRVDAATHGMASTKALFYPQHQPACLCRAVHHRLRALAESGSHQPGIGLAISLPLFDAGTSA